MQGTNGVSRWALVGLLALLCLAGTATAQQSRVFVTNEGGGNGNLGGLSGADAICQSRADAASLGGEWVAWLSTTTVDAKDRLTATGPFVRATQTGTTIADNVADLTDGDLDAPIQLDEFGGDVGQAGVWTGTKADGTVDNFTCADWTNPTDQDNGVTGNAASTVGVWTAGVAPPCDTHYRLYCFEQAATVSAAPPVGLAVIALLLLVGGSAFSYRRQSAH